MVTTALAGFDSQAVERRPPLWRLLHEVVLLGGLWAVYTLGRVLAGRHTGPANGHASDVWALERSLQLPDEAAVQRMALQVPDLVRAANAHYKYAHFATLAVVVIYLLLWRPDRYPWFRRVLVLTTAMGLVGHLTYPLTPPRLRPDFGVLDTGVRFGESVYGADPDNHGLVNQYAAMPSLHVAWAVLFAITVLVVARPPWRWLVVPYPVATTYVVVVTGNHYWLDGIVGIAILGVALLMCASRAPVASRPCRGTEGTSDVGDTWTRPRGAKSRRRAWHGRPSWRRRQR